jgi:hypothetical protein
LSSISRRQRKKEAAKIALAERPAKCAGHKWTSTAAALAKRKETEYDKTQDDDVNECRDPERYCLRSGNPGSSG